MKPRNKFEKAVAASNGKPTALSPQAVEWAVRNVIVHIAFRTSGHKCTCGDCGQKFDYKGKGKFVHCPHCRHRMKVADTLKRRMTEKAYFSTIERVDGFQVQRVFLLDAVTRKGKKLKTWQMEVCRLWLDNKGKTAVTSRTRTLGHYADSFNWMSDIELRNMTNVHWVISDTYVYPHYSTMKELRRNGMRGRLPDCHPTRLAQTLLSDSRIETMMKAKDYKAVEYFIGHKDNLDRCWQSYKIARRHRYEPDDYELWCDMVILLEMCGRDIRSDRYICPTDLKAEHDNISDNDIEISVLDSIEAFRAEGEKLHHCVFKCEYYAKKDSIILSAHDLSGTRIETVEFSIKQGEVVQSRGMYNSDTEYHDRIVGLVNANAYRFLEAGTPA